MHILIFLWAINIIPPVFAKSCYKKLCTRDVVRDQFGWKGTVIEFDREKDQVIVGLSHVPAKYSFPYDDLGKSVACFLNICIKDLIKDPYQQIVEVIEIYNHGLVYIYDESVDGFILYGIDEL